MYSIFVTCRKQYRNNNNATDGLLFWNSSSVGLLPEIPNYPLPLLQYTASQLRSTPYSNDSRLQLITSNHAKWRASISGCVDVIQAPIKPVTAVFCLFFYFYSSFSKLYQLQICQTYLHQVIRYMLYVVCNNFQVFFFSTMN